MSVDFLHRSTFLVHFSDGTIWIFFLLLLLEVKTHLLVIYSSHCQHELKFTRNSASSVHTAMYKHVHRFHTQSFLLRQHTKWDSRLNSCWRFQFSPVTYRRKLELRKRVCRNSMIAFCTGLHIIVHRIHKSVELHANKIHDSFSCFDSACDSFGPREV